MLEFTNEELNILPQWARVAFAARCAQRVNGLFPFCWKDAPNKYALAVERAVAVAAKAAKDGIHQPDNDLCIDISEAVTRTVGKGVAHASAFAAHSAVAIAMLHEPMVEQLLKEHHAMSSHHSSRAARQVDCEVEVFNAQRYDFLMLKRLAEIHGWDDDSPVDPEICGPIWPEGVPEKWPLPDPDVENRKQGEYLDLMFDLPPDVDDETAQHLIRELYEKLNDHHIAHGGNGLVLDNYQAFEPQPAEVLS
jgi:hypothetical protein